MAVCGTQVAKDSTVPHFLQGRGSDDSVLSFTKSKVAPTVPQCLECCTLSSSGLSGCTENHPRSALEEWKQLHPGSFSQSSSHPQRPHSSSCRTPQKTLGKHSSHVGLGADALHHLSAGVPGTDSAVATPCLSERKQSLPREGVFFSYQVFYIYSKAQLSKTLDYPGDVSSWRGCGDWGIWRVGLRFNFKTPHCHTPSLQAIFSGTVT